MAQWVYRFGDGGAGGDASMKNLLGGKGANLAEMSNLGLPVPPGFTISTEVCTYFYDHGQTYPADLTAAVDAALAHVGTLTGKKFGDSLIAVNWRNNQTIGKTSATTSLFPKDGGYLVPIKVALSKPEKIEFGISIQIKLEFRN